ncbi:MazG nucleotide pyrophosphohydrolase domain-containing protein [Dietzia sp. ANT_WB102]|uniref:MazG nucleotide pyrophosphohydrolase domain-containing protein n=1 Tax=Dietzia sp. ANT_WB102 TaxID=2597345 RepID=UPI0011EDDC96|nr:MazG nucleotide pyrophosphohydrolase domain-containing protein [Dietzia sp. ANT_WB102]KAA0919236.1 nucleoside triphosphate hydrolase [Dietzia sp. ANT_WB102]
MSSGSAEPGRERAAPARPDGTRSGGDRLVEAVEVMARIRRDGKWESAQTHASLLPYLLEESWELVDAVADGDRAELVSELGDLLLQVLFHAAIGAEHPEQPFDIQDVAGALLDKLRRRAPYWFTDDAGAKKLDAAEQDRLWQQAKAGERAGRTPRGVVEGISWDMPALALGQKVLARVRSAGVPEDLVPAEMRVVHVEPTGLFRDRATGTGTATDTGSDTDPDTATAGSGSAEVDYRRVVRRFARSVSRAEALLAMPVAEATAADWRAAWPH